MSKTPVWQLPYPDLDDPADIMGVDGVDDLAQRLEVLLSQLRAAGAIPGEMKLWSGSALPDLSTYGHWVWSDGASYDTVTYPLAAANIDAAWRTANGVADPGAGKFRVPDMRGLAPFGMDAMPGGARANRVTRAAAAAMAGRMGEELHALALAEVPAHDHPLTGTPTISDPGHPHLIKHNNTQSSGGPGVSMSGANALSDDAGTVLAATTGISVGLGSTLVGARGGGGSHENMPPAVFVPYIVKLDD
jgi:microcystin-dependent protein